MVLLGTFRYYYVNIYICVHKYTLNTTATYTVKYEFNVLYIGVGLVQPL